MGRETNTHVISLTALAIALGIAGLGAAGRAEPIEVQITKVEARVTAIEQDRAAIRTDQNRNNLITSVLEGIQQNKIQIAHDEGEAQGLFGALGLVNGAILLLLGFWKKNGNGAAPAPPVVVVSPAGVVAP